MAVSAVLAKPEQVASPPPKPEHLEAAESAGLRYTSDSQPGIRRRRSGRGFTYTGPDGKPVRDKETLARIKTLAIPPAWTDVWICPHARGHIQATGRDARGRKQYRYHHEWRKTRDDTKYERMLAFGDALPRIRERVRADLRKQGLPREKVLATIVSLLERTSMRVGNEEYARQNRSYGLTTLRDQHAEIDGHKVTFAFRGKSGVRHEVDVHDPRLARIVARCQALPGQELFQYEEDGEPYTVDSGDVNDYLREISGESFTAKDFRTWSGTVLAALALQEYETFDTKAQAKKNVVRAIESVAEQLGNTPAVCRKCYVHPEVVEAYLEGDMLDALKQQADREAESEGLEPEEAAVLALLRRRLAVEADKAKQRGAKRSRKKGARPSPKPRTKSGAKRRKQRGSAAPARKN